MSDLVLVEEEGSTVVVQEVGPAETIEVVASLVPEIVEVLTAGPQGPQGIQGLQGIPGEKGSDGDVTPAVTAAKTAAEASAASALASQTSAASAATTATTKAAEALASASSASTSAGTATSKAAEATSAATASSGSASTATTKATEASASAAAALASQNAAASSATGAATSATTATTKATEAATSATSASGSATTATSQATIATTKAAEAVTSASNAAGSASAAAGSATTASTGASTATTQATAAGTSASAAQTSATNAASSATTATASKDAAAVSATTASTKASEAAASATAASGSASTAATQAATATTKASEATASATAAAGSATSASGSATTATTQSNLAATKATEAAGSATGAATSATNASTSATNAAASASTATTQAGVATTKAGEASTSAATATTKASEASASATAAATAKGAAEAARDQTLAAFDSFDDRYLGQKTSDPTVDNDGNALAGGALYFNTNSLASGGGMKVYDAANSAWLAAYASLSGALTAANNLSDLASASAALTNLGLGNVENKSSATIRGELSSANVTSALEFTPYSDANPTGFITSAALSPYLTSATAASTYQPIGSYLTGITSGQVTTALGFTPYNSTNPSSFITSSALTPYLTSATAATTYQPLLGFTAANKAGDTFTGNVFVNTGVDSRFLIQSSGVTQGQFQTNGTVVRLASNNALPLALSSNGLDRITIDGNGNVVYGGTSLSGVHTFRGTNTSDLVVFESTDPSATAAPDVVLYRNSASPAAADQVGILLFRGKDSGGADQSYARILSTIIDPTAGAEIGDLRFGVQTTGGFNDLMILASAGLSVTGVVSATSFSGSGASLTGLTSDQVTSALGFTPYNDTNPSGYLVASTASSTYQTILVSGTSIKTINGNSVLGSGDLVISGGGSGDVTLDGVQTLTNKTLITPRLSFTAASSSSGSLGFFGTQFSYGDGLFTRIVVSTDSTQTLTNKRITPRIVSITSASTITPTGDTADQYVITAQAAAATINAPSGTPTDGQKLLIRIEDNGVARTLSWAGAYRAIGVTLPTTTAVGKVLYIGAVYNSQDIFWDVIAVAAQA